MITALVIFIYLGGLILMIPYAARFMVKAADWPMSLHEHRRDGLKSSDMTWLFFLCAIWPASAPFITVYWVGYHTKRLILRLIKFGSVADAVNRSIGIGS